MTVWRDVLGQLVEPGEMCWVNGYHDGKTIITPPQNRLSEKDYEGDAGYLGNELVFEVEV